MSNEHEEIDDEESEYEAMRRRNMELLKAQFEKEFGKSKPILTPLRNLEKMSPSKENRREPRKYKYKQRTENEQFKLAPRRSLRIKGERVQYNFDPDESLPDDDDFKPMYRKLSMPTIRYKPIPVDIQPEDVKEETLKAICYRSSNKKYDPVNGTTCHQCRQKTVDRKSICRSSQCSGVRGQFCGFCLANRYGEDVGAVLRDPKWKCPPCRNICNCSICRTRRGKMPTGILAPIALSNGYKCVKDFLQEKEPDMFHDIESSKNCNELEVDATMSNDEKSPVGNTKSDTRETPLDPDEIDSIINGISDDVNAITPRQKQALIARYGEIDQASLILWEIFRLPATEPFLGFDGDDIPLLKVFRDPTEDDFKGFE